MCNGVEQAERRQHSLSGPTSRDSERVICAATDLLHDHLRRERCLGLLKIEASNLAEDDLDSYRSGKKVQLIAAGDEIFTLVPGRRPPKQRTTIPAVVVPGKRSEYPRIALNEVGRLVGTRDLSPDQARLVLGAVRGQGTGSGSAEFREFLARIRQLDDSSARGTLAGIVGEELAAPGTMDVVLGVLDGL